MDKLKSELKALQREIEEFFQKRKLEMDPLSDDWEKEIEIQNEEFYHLYHNKILNIQNKILEKYTVSNQLNREKIRKEILSHSHLRNFIGIRLNSFYSSSETEKKGLMVKAFSLEIILDFGNDYRDSAMRFHALVDKCKELGLDYKQILSELLDLANSEKHTDLGSMKSFLQKLIST